MWSPRSIRYFARRPILLVLVPAGRCVEDFVSLAHLAPFFLEAGGVLPPIDDEERIEHDRVLLKILQSKKTGFVMGNRCRFMVYGKERHIPAQEAPNMGGYPSRALRYQYFLFIRNYHPDRWPNGTPDRENATVPAAWYADTDNSPSKTYMVENRNKDDLHRRLYDAAFAKRPDIELYDLRNDPQQLNNVADVLNYRFAIQLMGQALNRHLKKRGDPRAMAGEIEFDNYPYLGDVPEFQGVE